MPDLRTTTGYRGTLLTDPSLQAFAGLGFASGIGGFVGWRPLKGAIKALRSGYRPGVVQGDIMQLGGALVVDTDGRILFRYRSEKAGDHPSIESLLDAPERIRTPGARSVPGGQ